MNEVLDPNQQSLLVGAIEMAAHHAAQAIVDLATRPHVLMRPRVFPDGNKWCALLGVDIMVGVVGFGVSPAAACEAFDEAWRKPAAGPKESVSE